jgi:hypothetical protein
MKAPYFVVRQGQLRGLGTYLQDIDSATLSQRKAHRFDTAFEAGLFAGGWDITCDSRVVCIVPRAATKGGAR